MATSKRFYVDRGFDVAKSYGRKFVSFTDPDGFVWEAPRSDWQRAGSATTAIPTDLSHIHVLPSPVRCPPTSPDSMRGFR